jgi:hypothetical protein
MVKVVPKTLAYSWEVVAAVSAEGANLEKAESKELDAPVWSQNRCPYGIGK